MVLPDTSILQNSASIRLRTNKKDPRAFPIALVSNVPMFTIVTKGSVSYIPEFSVLQHNHTGYWGASQVRANVEAKRRILGFMY